MDDADGLNNPFPIQIKEVKAADDPMTAVAEGLLIKALSKYSKKE